MYQRTQSSLGTTTSLARVALLPGLRAWSRILALRHSKGFPPLPKQSEAHGCSSTRNTEPNSGPIDRPTSRNAALLWPPYERIVGEDDHGAAAVAFPPGVTPPPLSPQSPASAFVIEEQEWKIREIVPTRLRRFGTQWTETYHSMLPLRLLFFPPLSFPFLFPFHSHKSLIFSYLVFSWYCYCITSSKQIASQIHYI